MQTILRRLWSDDSAAVAVEYSLIASLVGVAAIAVLSQLGDLVVGLYNEVTTTLELVIARL